MSASKKIKKILESRGNHYLSRNFAPSSVERGVRVASPHRADIAAIDQHRSFPLFLPQSTDASASASKG